jgi:hypothetical protein
MNRTEQRQLARALGWRGEKTKRVGRYIRPEFISDEMRQALIDGVEAREQEED